MLIKPLAQANQEKPKRESLGKHLRSAREGRNLSLLDAAAATRISQRVLTALEADDFAALPAEVFTRGFIKIYAEYLGLNTNTVLTLFTDQEHLDPERPADRPYRNDILHGTAMANPLHLLKGNPRLRILLLLLAALLTFYVLGAIFKSVQKHPDQDSPENEVAKSLVNGQPSLLPVPAGQEVPAVTESTPQALTTSPPLSGNQPDPQANPPAPSEPSPAPAGENSSNLPSHPLTPPSDQRNSLSGRDQSRKMAEGSALQQNSSRPSPQAAVTIPASAESRSSGSGVSSAR